MGDRQEKLNPQMENLIKFEKRLSQYREITEKLVNLYLEWEKDETNSFTENLLKAANILCSVT